MIGVANDGRVAQLGEHLLCKQGVVGSSPITSTRNGVEVVAYRLCRLADPTGGITEKHGVRCCRNRCGASCFDRLFRGWFGDAVGEALGHVVSGACSFIIVNQVLVRLWARCGRKSDRMWFFSREGLSCGAESSRDRGNVFRGVCCVLSEMSCTDVSHQSAVVGQ